jgi:hypothetical protein
MDSFASTFVSASVGATGVASTAATGTLPEFERSTRDAVETPSGLGL